MTAMRRAPLCWPLLLLSMALSAGAGEPGRPGEPNPFPAANAGHASAAPQPIMSSFGGEHPAAGTCSCPSCAARPRPLRNYWVNRLKPCPQQSHRGYPKYSHELPLGSSLYDHMRRQILNGARDQMVLYRYDFEDETEAGAERLNEYGHRRLEDLARWLQCGLFPLVVEGIPAAPELNEARRRYVVERLTAAGIPASDDLVVVGTPAARGLSGEEAEVIYENQLRQTRQGGTSRTGAGAAGISAAPPRIPEIR